MSARSILHGFLGCLLLLPNASLTFAQSTIPDTPAGKRLTEVIEFVNTGENKDFLKNGFKDQRDDHVEHRVQQTEQIRSQLGSFDVQKTESTDDHRISAICKTSKGPQVVLSIDVSDDQPHQITRIALEVGNELAPTAEEARQPLTGEARSQAVNRLIEELKSKYVFPEVAEKMAVSLETSLNNGEYDEIENADQFASQLTKQLREICQDKHLRVRTRSVKRQQRRVANREISNHGFVKAEMLTGGIGYLKFNFFDGSQEAEKTAAAAMNFLASSRAIIFDLRENGGGSPEMIAFLSGYLFDESVHLNSFYNRPSDTTTESWSRDDVPGDRLGEDVPVYVLTSNYTFSGAEEFSYNLKHLKRGTIVGETTGGGAHPVRPVTLGSRFEASMPFARAINPITKTNWEGTGVKPHVEVEAESALEKALELANASLKKSQAQVSTGSSSKLDTGSIMRQAQQHMNSQEFDQAAEKFNLVVADNPENGMAWFQLGYSLHMSGDLDKAIKAHTRAMDFKPVEVLATYNLACAYALQNNTDAAIVALESAIQKGFADPGQLQSDSDLDNLRDDERFKKIAEQLKKGAG